MTLPVIEFPEFEKVLIESRVSPKCQLYNDLYSHNKNTAKDCQKPPRFVALLCQRSNVMEINNRHHC